MGGGGGGQKNPKIDRRLLWTAPVMKTQLSTTKLLFQTFFVKKYSNNFFKEMDVVVMLGESQP